MNQFSLAECEAQNPGHTTVHIVLHQYRRVWRNGAELLQKGTLLAEARRDDADDVRIRGQ